MENVDKRKDIIAVVGWENKRKRLGAKSLFAKPNFHSCVEITEAMVTVEMSRVRTEYNKPIYMAFSVLELSKCMYDDIRNHIPTHFDTTAYSKENAYNFPLMNKKVLGMIKDECNGKVIREFIGLWAKMCFVKIDRVDKEKKTKGVRNSVTARLSINDFRKCLLEKKFCHDSIYTIYK